MPKNVLNSNQTLDRIAKNYAIFAGTAGAVFVIFPALHTIVIYFMNQRKEVEIRKYVTSSVHEWVMYFFFNLDIYFKTVFSGNLSTF